jgi:uncharacterized protein
MGVGGVIAALRLAPVKGTAIQDVERAAIGLGGLDGDRRFSILDGRGGLLTSRGTGPLLAVRSAVRDDGRTLTLTFPDGQTISGPVTLGARAGGEYFGHRRGRLVEGAFAAALQRYLGRPAQLLAHDDDCPGWDEAPVTLVARASVAELARRAGRDAVDNRRFRMSVEIDGPGAHEEDDWIGREVALGDAVLRVVATCERCVITTRNPDTGAVDFNALRALAGYRGKDSVCLGVLCRVVRGGDVRVGDAVALRQTRVSACAAAWSAGG